MADDARRVSEVDALGALALDFAAARSASQVHRALHAFVGRLVPVNGFVVARYDAARQMRVCTYLHTDGAEADVATLPALPLNGTPNSRAIETREAVLVEDYPAAVEGKVVYVGLDRNPALPKCSLVVPMIAQDEVHGTLTVQSLEERAFDERAVTVLRLAANLAAVALQNVEMLANLEDRVRDRTLALELAHADLREQAVARDLARRLVKGVAARGRVRPEGLRSLGRELASGLEGPGMPEFAAAFAVMGLGDLEVLRAEDGRYELLGRDLLERERQAATPTCYLTLGFLEGAVATLHASDGLGVEVACQSQGAAACRFVIARR